MWLWLCLWLWLWLWLWLRLWQGLGLLAPRPVSIRSLAGPSRHPAGITGVSFLNFAACVGFGFCRSILMRSQTGRGHI